MAVKFVVLYPRPKDVEAFERVSNRDHVPMAGEKRGGRLTDLIRARSTTLR